MLTALSLFITDHFLPSGIGEIFEEVSVSLEGYYFVLVKPYVHVATKDAFGGISPQKPIRSLKEVIQLPIAEWKNFMNNDFEKTVFAKHPEISEVKHKMYESGAIYASMSGSGFPCTASFAKRLFSRVNLQIIISLSHKK